MSKRKKCQRSDCDRQWDIHMQVKVGDTGASGSISGKFCAPHAKECGPWYVEYLNAELKRFADRATDDAAENPDTKGSET